MREARKLVSDSGLDRLWELIEDEQRLSASERALLALALSELAERRPGVPVSAHGFARVAPNRLPR